MTENKRGRKPMAEDRKKVKLTLTVRPDTRNCLEDIADEHGLSMSEMVGKFVSDYVEAKLLMEEIERKQREKEARKAAREAKKAARENEQIDGQITTEDLGIHP